MTCAIYLRWAVPCKAMIDCWNCQRRQEALISWKQLGYRYGAYGYYDARNGCYEAARYIRNKQMGQVACNSFNSKSNDGWPGKCIAAGANDYITKPVDMDRLISLMQLGLGVKYECFFTKFNWLNKLRAYRPGKKSSWVWFSDYSKASLKRRLSRIMMIKKLGFMTWNMSYWWSCFFSEF